MTGPLGTPGTGRWARAMLIACVIGLLGGARAASAADLAGLLHALEDAPLDADGARRVHADVAVPMGRLQLDGSLVPRRAVAGHVREAVFVGDGLFEFDPPDRIERDQLERFTGRTKLTEHFASAVLVGGARATLDGLLGVQPGGIPATDVALAANVLRDWNGSPARLGQWLRTAQLAALVDGAGSAPLLAAWVRGSELGDFMFLADRDREEAVRLVQYSSDATPRRAALASAAAADSPAGGVADESGWDTWVAAPPDDGEPAAFRTVAHEISARIADPPRELAVTATMTLEAVRGGRRTVRLLLGRDFELDAVRLEPGREPLPVAREGSTVLVVLPAELERGTHVGITLLYHGRAFADDPMGGYRLIDSSNWHPRTRELDRAAYDVTLRWPKNLELVAAGREVASGSEGPTRWSRRVTDGPALLYSFAIGNYRTLVTRRDHTLIRVAVDAVADALRGVGDRQLLDAVTGPLAFFESRFGPYARDVLDVVTVPGALSQGGPGLVSLARSELTRDPRFALAHEIAHQWWGDAIAWAGERDRWICEALAQYSAYAYLRSIGAEPPVSEAAWRLRLVASAGAERVAADLGPLVLGRRLAGSVDPGGTGYVDIVYGKGALVFETLAGWFGGDAGLLDALRDVRVRQRGVPLTTTALFAQLAALAPAGLGWFEQLFVRGTGLPDVVYSYRIERGPRQQWAIRGEARQFTPARPTALLRRAPDGSFDVLDRARVLEPEPLGPLVLPFEVTLKRGGVRTGSIVLSGASTTFEVLLGERPASFALDPSQRLLVRTTSETDDPQRALALLGRRAAEAGDARGAEQFLRRALAIEAAPAGGAIARMEFEALRYEIELGLASALLDEDRLLEARDLLDALGPTEAPAVRARRLRLQARLELRTGQQRGPAVRALRAEVEQGAGSAGAAEFALLGLAASGEGQRTEAEALWRNARRLGADLPPEGVREQDRAGNWHRQ